MQQRPDKLPLMRACHVLGLNRSTVYAHQKRTANDDPPNKTRWNVAITVVCFDQRDLNIAAGTMLCAVPRGTALQLLEERGENIFHYEIIYSL